MADAEAIEKVRQEIMRFREVLNIMRDKLAEGERAYTALFSGFSADEMASTKEKDLQWKLAERMVTDLAALQKAALLMRFNAHSLERDFEELHDIIAATQNPE